MLEKENLLNEQLFWRYGILSWCRMINDLSWNRRWRYQSLLWAEQYFRSCLESNAKDSDENKEKQIIEEEVFFLRSMIRRSKSFDKKSKWIASVEKQSSLISIRSNKFIIDLLFFIIIEIAQVSHEHRTNRKHHDRVWRRKAIVLHVYIFFSSFDKVNTMLQINENFRYDFA